MGPEKSGRLDESCNSFDYLTDLRHFCSELQNSISKSTKMYWSQIWFHTPLIPTEIEEARPAGAILETLTKNIVKVNL